MSNGLNPNPLWLNVIKRWIHSKYLEEVKYISTLWQNNNHSFTNTKCPFVSTFWAQKSCFEKSQSLICVWFSTKRNFLEKIKFYICEETLISLNGAQSSILQKAPCVFESIRWTHRAITKLPSHTTLYSSHLFALPSAFSITNFQIQTQKNL